MRRRMKKKHSSCPTRAKRELDSILFDINSSHVMSMTISMVPNTCAFECTVVLHEGIYKNGRFTFLVSTSDNYPFCAPIVKCNTKVLHPSISHLTGEVFLPILNKKWRPTLGMKDIITKLGDIFLEPNLDTMNSLFRDLFTRLVPQYCNEYETYQYFETLVQQSLQGGFFAGEQWPVNNDNSHLYHAKSLKRTRSETVTPTSMHTQNKSTLPVQFMSDFVPSQPFLGTSLRLGDNIISIPSSVRPTDLLNGNSFKRFAMAT